MKQVVAFQAEGSVGDDTHQGDGEQQEREGQEDVHGPADDGVDPASEVAGNDPEHGPDDHAHESGDGGHEQ